MPQFSGMFPIHHGKLDREPVLEFCPGNLFFRGQKELKISADTSYFMDGQRFFNPLGITYMALSSRKISPQSSKVLSEIKIWPPTV